MSSSDWVHDLGPPQHFETLLENAKVWAAIKKEWLTAGEGDRRGLSLGLFDHAVDSAGCVLALKGDDAVTRSHLRDAVSYALAGLAAPGTESRLKVSDVTVTFTGENPEIVQGSPRIAHDSGALPTSEYAVVMFVVASFGTRGDREAVAAYSEENYRRPDTSEAFLGEVRALKAWCLGHESDAATIAQKVLRRVTPAGRANLRALMALREAKPTLFERALEQRLHVHVQLVRARPVAPGAVVCWAGMMLSRFARDIGWDVPDRPFLPTRLFNEA